MPSYRMHSGNFITIGAMFSYDIHIRRRRWGSTNKYFILAFQIFDTWTCLVNQNQ